MERGGGGGGEGGSPCATIIKKTKWAKRIGRRSEIYIYIFEICSSKLAVHISLSSRGKKHSLEMESVKMKKRNGWRYLQFAIAAFRRGSRRYSFNASGVRLRSCIYDRNPRKDTSIRLIDPYCTSSYILGFSFLHALPSSIKAYSDFSLYSNRCHENYRNNFLFIIYTDRIYFEVEDLLQTNE